MIKFFRKIRYDLMEKNKNGKYLKYAIGEILLVVIGILIALQINNWNELRKLKIIEIGILEGIRQDLVSDTIDINYNTRGLTLHIKKEGLMLSHLYNKKELDEKFLDVFKTAISADWTILLHNSTYEELKIKGLSLISNEELKVKISRLYQFHYPNLQREDNSDPYSDHRALMNSGWLDKYLKTDSTGFTMDSKTYNILLSDSHAHYMIDKSITMKKYLLQVYTSTLLKNNDLRVLIQSEIEHLEK